MSTRSYIILKEKDGSCSAIYCHWDGYPEGVGRVLSEHYTDEKKVRELISLGSLSSIGSVIGEKSELSRIILFGTNAPDQCYAYHRDRGEDLNIMKLTELPDPRKELDIEYFYYFENGNWYVYTADSGGAFPLKDILDGKAKL